MPAMVRSFAIHLVLFVAVAFSLYPILWVVSTALTTGDAVNPAAIPLPQAPSLQNFAEVMGAPTQDGSWLFMRQLLNSLLVASATAISAVLIATPAAYALSRFDFVGKQAATGTMLATQMFPGVAAIIPLFIILDALGLLNSLMGLTLVYATTAVPFALFQLRGAFDGIPRDLEEAAMVDGATQFGAFIRVVLPAARPAIAITALFAFMTAWNEFILAQTILKREELYTLPIVLWRYVGEHHTNWPHFAAGSILVSVPVMLLFYWLQRHLISGLTAGGIKG